MSDQEFDDLMNEMAKIELPEIEPEDFEIPDVKFDEEFLAEAAAASVENDLQIKRWVDSGFKPGGHLPPGEKDKFDRWVTKTLRLAMSDPVAAENRVSRLSLIVAHNNENMLKYKKWEKRARRRAKLGLWEMPPLLFLPSCH